MVCDTIGHGLGTASHPARGHSVATRNASLWPHLCVDDCASRVICKGGDVTEFKVIVAKNLTGAGHDQRIRAFLGELKNEAEIITVGSGRPPGKTIHPEQQPQYEFTGLTWKYGQSGIDISHAALQLLKLPALRNDRFRFAELLRELQPDGIWADFEFVACGGAQKYKQSLKPGERPIFTQRVDHHSAFLSPFVPRPPWLATNIPTDWFLRNFCKADQYEGFHFMRYKPGRNDLRIHTPIIQREIREAVARNEVARGEHVLGYLPGYSVETLTELLRPHTKRPWIVYHQGLTENYYPLSHVTFKPTGYRPEYLRDLLTCNAAVVTTGFQLPAELLYLKKFFIGTPQRAQPEQGYNAAALRGLGVPTVRRLTTRSMRIIDTLLTDRSEVLASICQGDMKEVYPDNTREIVQDFIKRCREQRQRCSGGSSPNQSKSEPECI
jgi:uncharacterized protein (TIGR00661 family)